MKKTILQCVMLVVMLCSTMYVQDGNASAKKEKVGFAKKKIAVTAGKKVILKFNNPKSKVKWKVSKKKVVKIVKKKGSKNNVVTLRGIKKGNCVVTAKCGGKKYRIRVTVKPKKKIPMGTIYGTAVNYKISMTDNLEIRIESKGTKTYYYGLEPGILERKSGNKWVQLKQKQDIAWIDIAYVLSGNQKQILSVPIHSYYKDVIPGQYRYTKAIGKEEVVVLFEIG